jgi:hypothetical protein
MATKPNAAKPKQAPSGDLKRIINVHGTLAFTSLTEPDQQSGKFSTLLIIDPESKHYQELEALVQDHSIALTGEPDLPARFHNPIREGDEKKSATEYTMKDEAFRGMKFVRLKSGYMPTLFTGENRVRTDISKAQGGDEVLIEVSAYNFSNQSSGVALSMGAIWLINKGERVIERGGASGSSFSNIDSSRFEFKTAINDDSIPY